jgi:hypothetical protein
MMATKAQGALEVLLQINEENKWKFKN